MSDVSAVLNEVEAEIGQAFIDLAHQTPGHEVVRSRSATFAAHRLFISMMEKIRERHEAPTPSQEGTK